MLTNEEAHVWRASLDQSAAVTRRFLERLSPDERERADRFYFEKDRRHFIVARGLLRTILGNYLHLEPERIRFSYNRYGKPQLGEDLSEQRLCFNLSHSQGVVLYAFAYRRELGLDVEYMREDFAAAEIAERFFSKGEVEVFRNLPAPLRVRGFFNCWTRKEAFIKAKGRGLSIPLDSFEVSLVPGAPAALLRTSEGAEETARWSMRELTAGPDYAAALIVEGWDWKLKCWQWEATSSSGQF